MLDWALKALMPGAPVFKRASVAHGLRADSQSVWFLARACPMVKYAAARKTTSFEDIQTKDMIVAALIKQPRSPIIQAHSNASEQLGKAY
jgi:hypothetical protein